MVAKEKTGGHKKATVTPGDTLLVKWRFEGAKEAIGMKCVNVVFALPACETIRIKTTQTEEAAIFARRRDRRRGGRG